MRRGKTVIATSKSLTPPVLGPHFNPVWGGEHRDRANAVAVAGVRTSFVNGSERERGGREIEREKRGRRESRKREKRE